MSRALKFLHFFRSPNFFKQNLEFQKIAHISSSKMLKKMLLAGMEQLSKLFYK